MNFEVISSKIRQLNYSPFLQELLESMLQPLESERKNPYEVIELIRFNSNIRASNLETSRLTQKSSQ